MSFGRRIYDILRAQVGHYGREAASLFGTRKDEDYAIPPNDEGSSGGRSHAGTKGSAAREAIADAYRLLEIPYGSDPDRIRAAHRELMRRFHPDRFARDEEGLRDATRLAQEITAARDLLLNHLGAGRSP